MPITQTKADAVLREFTQNYPGAKELRYVFVKEAPPGVKGIYLSGEHIVNGRSYRACVIVSLGNTDDAADLLATLRHEVLGHYGANTFAPDEKRALLDGIIAAREQPGIKDHWEDINRRYADRSMDQRAEEVLALYCETLAPSQHLGLAQVHKHGKQSFMETCIKRTRPMQASDLHNIACMLADRLHERSRTYHSISR